MQEKIYKLNEWLHDRIVRFSEVKIPREPFSKISENFTQNNSKKCMKKLFKMLSIFAFLFLLATSFGFAKAIDNTKNTTISAEYRDETIGNYNKHLFVSYKSPHSRDKSANELVIDFVVVVFKDILNVIKFIHENIWGFIFLTFVTLPVIQFFYNYKILKKYKRENNNNDENFTAKFCKEDIKEKDGNRRKVYLVNEVNKDEKTYQWIEDGYTLNKLGYGGIALQDDNQCFSNAEYTIKESIKIYNIILDTKYILKLDD